LKLSEILEHLARDYLDDRTDMVNGAPDEIWSNAALTRHLAWAENYFCRKAFVLTDNTTPAVCRVSLLLDQPTYALHKSVLLVKSVTPSDSDIDLTRVSYDRIRPRMTFSDESPWDVNTTYVEQSGRPLVYSTDNATRVLRLGPKPDATAVAGMGPLKLRVARLPVTALTFSEGTDPTPEIPEEYHLDLCDWAAAKALSGPNVDGEARAFARECREEFFAKVNAAKNDVTVAEQPRAEFVYGGLSRS